MYLTQGLHRSIQQHGGDVATIFGERQRTFAEVGDRCARLAGGLKELGVASGDRVAYLGHNSDRYSEYYLAVPWAGAVVTPLNSRWAPAEIAYALRDSGARVLIVDDHCLPVLTGDLARLDPAPLLIYAGDGPVPEGMVSFEELAQNGPVVEDVRRGGDALAGLFYTGGTTGFPKAVMLSHTNLLTSAASVYTSGVFPHGCGAQLQVTPLFHLAGVSSWLTQEIVGAKKIILGSFEPIAVFEAIEKHRIEALRLVPTLIQMLVDHPRFDEFDLSSVRAVGYGGSSISEALLVRASEKLPDVEFSQAFGQTELSPVTAFLGPEGHTPEARRRGLLRSAGRAAPHAEVRVVDVHDQPVANGVVGEIVAKGGHVMLGYWNQPELTATTMRGGWLHTGDAGYLDDEGYLFVVDRIKDMIVTGGENVYSAEVENALSSHPAVAACAVIGLPDDQWGERVHAFVVLAAGAEVTAEALRAHAKTLIAGYKCPRTFSFVAALPTTSTGKVSKQDLRARAVAEASV